MPILFPNWSFPSGSTTTSSTSLQDCSTSASLVGNDTNEWFVAYGASLGGNDASQVGEAVCVLNSGPTTIGIAAAEGNGAGAAAGGGRLQGFARVAMSGSVESPDSVKLQHRCQTSSDTNYIGARSIIAIPLNQPTLQLDEFTFSDAAPLMENADFFYSGTNSSSAEVSSVGNTWTTARTVDFTLASAGDYYVFFSVETKLASGGGTSDGHQARFQIDGTTQGAEWVREWENNADICNFAYADRVNLSAGARTFRIQVQNRNANSVLAAYRTRIWAFRCETFPVGAQDVETTGDSAITHTAYSDSEIFLTTSAVSQVDSRMVAFATVNLGSSAVGVNPMVEIRDLSNNFTCADIGYGYNDAGLDSGDDLMPCVVMQMHQGSYIPGTTVGSKVRTKLDTSGTGTAGRNAGNSAGVRNNLFIWPLFKAELPPLISDGDGLSTSHI